MKVCFITQNLYTLGGIQRVVTTILNELIKDNSYSVTVLMPFSMTGPKLFEIAEEIDIENIEKLLIDKSKTIGRLILGVNKRLGCLDYNWGNALIKRFMFKERELERLADFFNERQFDVVIGAGPTNSCLLAELCGKVSAKLIGWQHSTFDSYFKMRGRSFYGSSKYAKNCYKKLDAVWVLTRADKRQFDEEFGINSRVLYNPVAENKLVYTPKKNNILFVGRLVIGHKGLDYLVEIMEMILNRIPDAQLIVVGDGADREWLEDTVAQKGLKDQISIVGSTDNVYPYYQKAALMLQTSRYEGFGMTIVEAMACGIPVVAFHNYGPDEIINNGQDGYLINQYDLVDFANKSVELLQDQQLWNSFSERAFIRAQDFSINKILPLFKKYIEEIAN